MPSAGAICIPSALNAIVCPGSTREPGGGIESTSPTTPGPMSSRTKSSETTCAVDRGVEVHDRPRHVRPARKIADIDTGGAARANLELRDVSREQGGRRPADRGGDLQRRADPRPVGPRVDRGDRREVGRDRARRARPGRWFRAEWGPALAGPVVVVVRRWLQRLGCGRRVGVWRSPQAGRGRAARLRLADDPRCRRLVIAEGRDHLVEPRCQPA